MYNETYHKCFLNRLAEQNCRFILRHSSNCFDCLVAFCIRICLFSTSIHGRKYSTPLPRFRLPSFSKLRVYINTHDVGRSVGVVTCTVTVSTRDQLIQLYARRFPTSRLFRAIGNCSKSRITWSRKCQTSRRSSNWTSTCTRTRN